MRIISITLFIFILLFSCYQSFTIQQLTKTMDKIAKSPIVNLILIYDSATQAGPVISQMFQNIAKNKQGYFKVNLIDCNKASKQEAEKFQYCSSQVRSQLPALIFSQPPLNPINKQTGQKLEAINRAYQGGISEKALFDFATPLMKTYSQKIQKMSEWNKLQEKYKSSSVPIILHCTNKKTVSPFYKALTANFRKTIVFAHVLPNSKGQNPICDEFGVQKYPALLLNGIQNIKLSTDLKQMIQVLKKYQDDQTHDIYIQEQPDVSKNQIRLQQMEENIYSKAQPVLLHIAGPKGQIHSQWEKIQKSYKKMFTYYEGQGNDIIKETGVKKTPSIIYYPKSLAKKQIQKTIFTEGFTFDEINFQINGMVEDFTVPLAGLLQLQQLTSIALKDEKLVVMLFHQQEIPLTYKMLSNHQSFKQAMTFFRMKNPPPEIMQQFQIKKIPSLFIMTIDEAQQQQPTEEQISKDKAKANLKIAQFTGKFIYDQLSSYLSFFLKSSPSEPNQPDIYHKDVIKIQNEQKFKKSCVSDFCYLLLVNGAQENKQKNQNLMLQLQKISPRIAPSDNLAQIDGVCHTQLLQTLEIQQDQLPTVIYINSKFQKYTRLIGRVQQKALLTMVAKIKANKASYRGYKSLKINSKNCKQVHQKIKQLNQGGSSTLDEEEAAILQQIRRQQQQSKRKIEQQAHKNSNEGQKKKNKKKKKKPKKQWQNQDL